MRKINSLSKLSTFLLLPLRHQLRNVQLYEWEAKRWLRNHGLTVQKSIVIKSESEIYDLETSIKKCGIENFVVKAQIHAGGRGKGIFTNGLNGGVRLTKKYWKQQSGCVKICYIKT